MDFSKIHCKSVEYRSGFIEVLPNIYEGLINIETWQMHPDYDRDVTDLADERISDTDVLANCEIEMNVPQARELIRLLGLAIQQAESLVQPITETNSTIVDSACKAAAKCV